MRAYAVLLLCLCTSVGLGQEFITARSGNGTAGGTDTIINFLPGPFNAPFTTADFAAATAGAPAEIIAPGSFGWAPTLSNDPAALWISTAQSGAQPSALYAIPFTVTSTTIGAASLSVNMLVDDFLGDATNGGIYVNGTALPNTTSTAPGTWATEVSWSNLDITPWVTTGTNYLYLYGWNTGGPGGLNFHADITVYATAEWQVNQPGASLDINGVVGTAVSLATVSECAGQSVTVNFASTNVGLPWEVGITSPEPGRAASAGALVTPDNQVVNLWLNAPSITFVNGLSFAVPFPGNFSQPVTVSGATQTSAQMAVVAPTQASGFFLSGLTTLDTAAAATLPLALPDDGNIQVILGSSPLCYGPVSFYGTMYNDFYVNSNGDVSFTQGHSNFTSSATQWQTMMPRIGIHTDWQPNVYGSVDVTVVGPALQVNYNNMAEWGTGGSGITSYTIEFNGALAPLAITNFVAPTTWGATPVTGGISLGAGGTHPPVVSFDSLFGLGLQPNLNPTDSVIDENLTGMLVNTNGWTNVLFPLGDGSSYLIN